MKLHWVKRLFLDVQCGTLCEKQHLIRAPMVRVVMMQSRKQKLLHNIATALLASAVLLASAIMDAAQVATRHTEDLVRGFLVLRTLEGETIADGDLSQIAHGDRVTNRLVFHFKDGSVHEETAVFSQRSNFRLLSDHLVQKGPTFEHSVDAAINAVTGQITVHSTDDQGKEKVVTEHMNLPQDLANGMVFTLLKNIPPDAPETKVSMLATTPKSRLVKLSITAQGVSPFQSAVRAAKPLTS